MAVLLLSLMCVAILFVPRRQAVWPMIVIGCFITQAQRINIATLDFTMLRVIIVFSFLRLLIRNEFTGLKFNKVDLMVIIFMSTRIIWSFARQKQGVTSIQSLGEAMEMWGFYFYFRCVVRDLDDLRGAMIGFMLVSIPVAIAFIYEATALHNPFSFFGGVSEVTRARDGKLRCMGAYSHPILAGCYWAALLPYMGAMIKRKGRITYLPLLAIVCSTVIILLTSSSTPVMWAGVGFLGGCLFIYRKRMRLIRWWVGITMVITHFMISKGLWFILARINVFGGSTGYYRFKLIDQFIEHYKEWFWAGTLLGTSTWEVPMFDIVNYYVYLGLTGGILILIIMVMLLVASFKNVGRGLKTTTNVEDELMVWATGVSMFVHMVMFLVIFYFGQINMVWYFSLAVTSVSGANAAYPVAFGRRNMDPLKRLATRQRMPFGQPIRIPHG